MAINYFNFLLSTILYFIILIKKNINKKQNTVITGKTCASGFGCRITMPILSKLITYLMQLVKMLF